MIAPACPLCGTSNCTPHLLSTWRNYYLCSNCDLVFVDPAQLPSASQEREQYDLHRNEIGDPGYRNFLVKLADPLCAELPANAQGLDFGCGPGPALAAMLGERGYTMTLWDPLYANDSEALAQQYDFITCTEVAEHFHQPGDSFALLFSLLKPGGILALMTGWRDPEASFETWHYRRDPTHVSFYSVETLAWISRQYDCQLSSPARTVSLFFRN